MDKSEAIEKLEYLKAKAQLALEQEMPEWVADDILDTIEAYDMAIEALQTEPKRGEWITHDDEWGIDEECSVCKVHTLFKFDYCPHCGADMRKEGE